jgi:hypothetical protein
MRFLELKLMHIFLLSIGLEVPNSHADEREDERNGSYRVGASRSWAGGIGTVTRPGRRSYPAKDVARQTFVGSQAQKEGWRSG